LQDVRTTVLGTDRGLQRLPLLVGVLPSDDTDADIPIWIEALGCPAAARCARTEAVVTQRAVVRFTRGQTDVVPLLLASACVGVTCGGDERCATTGRCEPATRATVRPFDGSDAGAVADAARDAGGMDRGTVADAPMTDTGAPPDRNDLGTVVDAVVPVDVPAPDVGGGHCPDAGHRGTVRRAGTALRRGVRVDLDRPDALRSVRAGVRHSGERDLGLRGERVRGDLQRGLYA
jgi:hypothetical protein